MESIVTKLNYDAYKEYQKEVQNKWLDNNDYKGICMGPWITPMKPDLGFFIKVDVLEIPESLFPDEVKTITQAYHSVLEKLKNHHIERKAKTKL